MEHIGFMLLRNSFKTYCACLCFQCSVTLTVIRALSSRNILQVCKSTRVKYNIVLRI